jgi:hypothetical protein
MAARTYGTKRLISTQSPVRSFAPFASAAAAEKAAKFDFGVGDEAEARQATAILGTEEIEFWRGPDGALQASVGLMARLKSALRDCCPDVVYLPHPLDQREDHLAACDAVR